MPHAKEAASGLFGLAESMECITKIGVKGRFISIDFDGATNVVDCQLVFAHLGSDDAEQMQRIGLGRINGEDFSVQQLCGMPPAGLMMLDGEIEHFRNSGHCVCD